MSFTCIDKLSAQQAACTQDPHFLVADIHNTPYNGMKCRCECDCGILSLPYIDHGVKHSSILYHTSSSLVSFGEVLRQCRPSIYIRLLLSADPSVDPAKRADFWV